MGKWTHLYCPLPRLRYFPNQLARWEFATTEPSPLIAAAHEIIDRAHINKCQPLVVWNGLLRSLARD